MECGVSVKFMIWKSMRKKYTKINQRTLNNTIECRGIGCHTGENINLKIHPAPSNHGIVFIRTDIENNNVIPALFDNVTDTRMCTVISNNKGAKVGTIEHLMSAFWGADISNALVTIDGPEVPAMDGSSSDFLKLIKSAGIIEQDSYTQILEILESITIEDNGKMIRIEPAERFSIDFTIEFSSDSIGKQSFKFSEDDLSQDFEKEISNARTFGFIEDLEKLQNLGLAKGASFQNAVVVSKDGILNTEGLRYKDEFVRHKILDCIGDLYLAGAKIKGKVTALKAGHSLNNKLLKQLFYTN